MSHFKLGDFDIKESGTTELCGQIGHIKWVYWFDLDFN